MSNILLYVYATSSFRFPLSLDSAALFFFFQTKELLLRSCDEGMSFNLAGSAWVCLVPHHSAHSLPHTIGTRVHGAVTICWAPCCIWCWFPQPLQGVAVISLPFKSRNSDWLWVINLLETLPLVTEPYSAQPSTPGGAQNPWDSSSSFPIPQPSMLPTHMSHLALMGLQLPQSPVLSPKAPPLCPHLLSCLFHPHYAHPASEPESPHSLLAPLP